MTEPILTSREREIVRRLAMGGGNRKIAADLGIAPRTVSTHLHNASEKLDVYTRTRVLLEALRLGEVTFDELIAPAHVIGPHCQVISEETGRQKSTLRRPCYGE